MTRINQQKHEQEQATQERKFKDAGGRPAKVEVIIAKLREMEFLQDVLRTDQGMKWLANKQMRESVNQFIVEQRKEEEEPAEELKDDEKVFDDEIRRIVNRKEGAITDELYKGITELDLPYKGLKTLPTRIGKLTALQRLELHANQLTSVPEAIGELTALKILLLYDNQLTTVPEAIGKLTALKILSLHDNQLTTVPEAIGKLTALQELYLPGNQLTTVPEAIGKLTNLKMLNLQDNNFSEEEKNRIRRSVPQGCEVRF